MKPVKFGFACILIQATLISPMYGQFSFRTDHKMTGNQIAQALIGDLIQAVKQQDIRRLESLVSDGAGSGARSTTAVRIAAVFQQMNRRPSLQRDNLRGTADFAIENPIVTDIGDSIQVECKATFLLSAKANQNPLGRSEKFTIAKKNGVWRIKSLDPLLEKMERIAFDLVLPTSKNEGISMQQSSYNNILLPLSLAYRFTDQTLSWRNISYPIDQNGDGIITRLDPKIKYGRTLMYGPKDAADIVYASGEEVYFVLDEVSGFICYITSSDNVIRYFEPQGTSIGAFNFPKAIVADMLGNVYVLDSFNNRIVKLHYNSGTKRFDTWSVLNNQLNKPLDFDLSYGSSESDPTDDRLVVANTGSGNILVVNVGTGSIVNTITSYWYYLSEIGGPTATVSLYSPRSVATARWRGIGSGFSNPFIYEIDYDGTNYFINSFDSQNLGSSPLGRAPQFFPTNSEPSRVRVDAFENWGSSYENVWVFDDNNGQLHKFYLATTSLKYLCSIGSNGFALNQFNGPKSLFITQNHSRSSIYTDLMTIERYTDASGGRWYKPGSEVFDLAASVSTDRSNVTFTFSSIGNSWLKSALIKNSSGQVIADRSIDVSYSPGNQIVLWSTNGNRGNFTLELYMQHVGNVSSVSRILPFSVIDPISVSISGPWDVYHPAHGSPANYYSWTANVSGGISPISYSWLKSGYQVGTSQSYGEYFSYDGSGGGTTQFTLSVNVVDASSPQQNASDGRTITEHHSGGGPEAEAAPGMDLRIHFVPSEFGIAQNYPNPFNPETQIAYSLPEASSVKVTILDVLGRVINVLSSGNQKEGIHSVRWNGIDLSGQKVGGGIYFCRFIAIGASGKEFKATKKMLLVK